MTTKCLAQAMRASLLASVVLSTPVVMAEEGRKVAGDIKTGAAKLLKQGAFEEACDLLDKSNDVTYDAQLVFLRGQCRFGMLDYSAAAFHYELMLERNTNLPRVRTELARTLAAMGKSKAAKKAYEEVLAGELPPVVQQNVEAQLRAIDEQRRFHGAYSLGLMYDSNVNAAPADPNIKAFGLPFLLDQESTERSDMGLQGSISAGTYFDGPFGDDWRFDAYGNFLKYDTETDFDSESVGLSVGPNFYSNYRLALPVGYSTSWEGGARATQSVSFSPSLSRSLNSQLRVSGQLSVQHSDDLRVTDEANGWSKGLSGNLQYSLNPTNMIEIGISVLNNDANESEYNRYLSKTVNAGWHTAFRNAARLSLQTSLTNIEYEAADPVDMGVVRDDDRYGVNLSIYKDVTVGSTSFTPVLSVGWSKNDSNIDRRDYERETISLQLRKQF